MSIRTIYKNGKMKTMVRSVVRALVPAYLDGVHHFFCCFPDRKPLIFEKKNTFIALTIWT